MKNLYIMIIYRCHNYLRKNSNKTIEILFKISGQIQPPPKSILNLVSKKYKMSNFIIIMVEKLLNIMLITCREHSDHQTKLIIIVITACCATCTLIYMVFHHICRVCIKAPTVIAWAYQFIGMLPMSMCYTGSPCGTLKCTLLTFITPSDVSADCIPYANMFCHTFCTMIVLSGIFCFMCTPGDLGTTFLCGSF